MGTEDIEFDISPTWPVEPGHDPLAGSDPANGTIDVRGETYSRWKDDDPGYWLVTQSGPRPAGASWFYWSGNPTDWQVEVQTDDGSLADIVRMDMDGLATLEQVEHECKQWVLGQSGVGTRLRDKARRWFR
jgi:hypothetical protein